MKGQIGQLMQQAQRMQEDMKRAQDELAKTEVTGTAGGGLVSVTMSGGHEVRSVHIDRQAFADDPEMAEALGDSQLPVVAVGSSYADPACYPAKLPYIATDNSSSAATGGVAGGVAGGIATSLLKGIFKG